MTLTVVNGNYKPAWGCGGPARLSYELATHFRRRHWKVSVVTSNFSGESCLFPAGQTVEDGIRVNRLSIQSRSYLRGAAVWPSGLVGALYRELKICDAALIFNTRSAFAMVTSAICRGLNRPYGLAAVGSLPGGPARINRVGRYFCDPAVVFPNCRKADFCVAQTDNEREEYLKVGVASAKIRLIPLGADADRFRQLPPRGLFRQRVGVEETAPVALFVGRLHYLKGVDSLIKATYHVTKTLPDFKLIIVGKDVGDEARLRSCCKELGLERSVVFAGPLYEDDVLQAYVDADAYTVTPRHDEETSLASIEAAFCGTPLIFTKEAEAPFFSEGGGGICVRNTVESIADGILTTLSDRVRLRRMAAAARDIAMNHYAMEAVGRSYEEAFAKG